MELVSIFDLDIPQLVEKPNGLPAPREIRQVAGTRKVFRLLETREELRGVYGPADAIAEQLRWSA